MSSDAEIAAVMFAEIGRGLPEHRARRQERAIRSLVTQARPRRRRARKVLVWRG